MFKVVWAKNANWIWPILEVFWTWIRHFKEKMSFTGTLKIITANPRYGTNFSFLILWATFDGCGHHARPLKRSQKVAPLDGPFGSTAISKSCFLKFSRADHPPLIWNCVVRQFMYKLQGYEKYNQLLISWFIKRRW